MNLFLEKIRGDKIIWSIVIFLAVFSFLPVYSASSNFGNSFVVSNVLKHFAIIIVGILIMYGTHLIPYKYFKGLSKLALPFIITVLLFTSLQGSVIDGANASRWIKLPIIGLSFQPSSMATVVLMVYVSFYLSKNYNKNISFFKNHNPFMDSNYISRVFNFTFKFFNCCYDISVDNYINFHWRISFQIFIRYRLFWNNTFFTLLFNN